MSLQTLQGMLDESRRNGSPFTNSLEGEVQSAVQLEQFVNATRNVTLAVVRRGGLPHAAPVIGGCIDAPQGWDGFIYLLHPRRLFAW
ncbi:MAG TPA: hypothetical protein VGL48_05730 [Acidimicrobiales bacterium]|jgi:hypothetical protein